MQPVAAAEKKSSMIMTVLKSILKLALAGAIIYYFIGNKFNSETPSQLAKMNIFWLVAGVVIYGIHILVFSWRWRIIAILVKISISNFKALSLSMQGIFFALVIPGGTVGGDFAKIGIFCNQSEKKRLEGAFSVFMDRIVGMISLFVLALSIIPFGLKLFHEAKLPQLFDAVEINHLLLPAIVVLCLAGLGCCVLIFFHNLWRKIPFIDHLMDFGNRVTKGRVERMCSATDRYATKWRTLFEMTLISLFFVHIFTALALCCLLSGLGVEYSVFTVVLAMTVGNIVGLIPFFPSGVGIRDVVVIAFLMAGGVNEESASIAQLIYTGIIIFYSLLGGLFFVFDNKKQLGKRRKTT